MTTDVQELPVREVPSHVEALLHDMRGPLTVIRGQCHAIVRAAMRADDVLERLRIIDGEVDRVVDSITAIRRALRGTEGSLERGCVDIGLLVRDVAAGYGGAAAEAQLRIELVGDGGPIRVAGSRPDLHRMLDNLVSNAVRHSPRGGVVRLESVALLETAVIRVIDEGPGLRVTGCNEREIPPVAGGSSGWGIGLAIVRQIVSGHGGRITFESAKRGTIVRVELPLAGLSVPAGVA